MVFPSEAPWNVRIRMVRQYREETQQTVADQLGTTCKMVRMWEKGQVRPNVYSRKRIALWAKEPMEILFKGMERRRSKCTLQLP